DRMGGPRWSLRPRVRRERDVVVVPVDGAVVPRIGPALVVGPGVPAVRRPTGDEGDGNGEERCGAEADGVAPSAPPARRGTERSHERGGPSASFHSSRPMAAPVGSATTATR